MSIQFNDTDSYRGLVQLYERECGFNRGDIANNNDRLKEFTADVNNAIDDFITIAIQASGKWQIDDSNQTDYPIIRTNIVSGQRDYTFTDDGSDNLILDIMKVAIKSSATDTQYNIITPFNELESDNDIITETTRTGTPTQYAKIANGILFDIIPNYSVSNGLKVYINREASYFVYTDTDKNPGFPGVLHEYFALKPAYKYARIHSLANKSELEKIILDYEGSERLRVRGKIAEHFSLREKDDVPIIINEPIIYQ